MEWMEQARGTQGLGRQDLFLVVFADSISNEAGVHYYAMHADNLVIYCDNIQ